YARRVRSIISVRESGATQQRDAKGWEIRARHKIVVGIVAELRLVGSSWNTYGTAQTTAGHRCGRGDTRCFHPGQCFESLENLAQEPRALLAIGIFCFRQRDVQDERSFGIIPSRCAPEMPETLEQETGPNQQDERKRNLRDDQSSTDTIMRSGRRTAPALLERVVQVQRRNLERRKETKRDSSGKRNQQREGQHSTVEVGFAKLRKFLCAPKGQCHTKTSSEQR